MNAMVIGISPQYNYPGRFADWRSNNTYYASNHGGSLITRSIMKEFQAEYVDDFSDIEALRFKFDTCFLAFATHLAPRRDVSYYVDIVRKLDMQTIMLSLGIKDYVSYDSMQFALHPSVIALLTEVSRRSAFIGVRGSYSATVLYRYGFKNVVPVGCPTIFSNMKKSIRFDVRHERNKVVFVYHREVAERTDHLLRQSIILGQDCFDQAVFTDSLSGDFELLKMERNHYQTMGKGAAILSLIKKRGIFPDSFEEWISIIRSADIVIGGRLHGCIAALLAGIPAVLVPRDLRTNELADFLSLPSIAMEQAESMSLPQIMGEIDFPGFFSTYERRYGNYLTFLSENDLDLAMFEKVGAERYSFSLNDLHLAYGIGVSNTSPRGHTRFEKAMRKIKQVLVACNGQS